jgi:hypothetical protein
MMQLLLAVIN